MSTTSAPRRPLYLLPEQRTRVLAEDESLAAYRQLTLQARYPIARVDRIICNQQVDWAGGAITMCLAHRIPIVWITVQGRLAGRALPWTSIDPEWAELLLRYSEIPDCEFLFDNWLRRQRQRSWSRAKTRLATASQELGPSRALEQLRRDFVHGGRLPPALEDFRGAATLFVMARLLAAKLPDRVRVVSGCELMLAERLAEVAVVETCLAGTVVSATATPRLVGAAFEGWSSTVGGRVLELIASFRTHMERETLECP